MSYQAFEGLATIALALIGASDHEAPEENTWAINAIVVIRTDMQQDETDGRLIGVDSPHPSVFGEVGLSNGNGVVADHETLLRGQGVAELADLDHSLGCYSLEMDVGRWRNGFIHEFDLRAPNVRLSRLAG